MLNFLELIKTTLGRFRIIAFIEGMSYLILLFVAMPVKYIIGDASFVKSFGSIHGGLFVLYVIFVLICHFEYNWRISKTLFLLAMSLVPFGNFYADKRLRTA
jgi:integral membrane protein